MWLKATSHSAHLLKIGIFFCVAAGGECSESDDVINRPRFATQASSFEGKEGKAVSLPCVLVSQGPHVVVWMKDRRVLSADGRIVARDERYSLEEGNNLRIASLVPEDRGTYTCSVDTKPLMELTHKLNVLYGPIVTTEPVGGVLVEERGKETELKCEAHGNPSPTVYWRKQAGTLPSGEDRSDGPVYTISKVTREMAGVYECVAENGLGKPGIATLSLRIQYPPEIEVERSVVYSGEGREARLVCFVYADPRAEVRWARESEPLEPARHLPTEDVVVGTRHVLTIRPVQMVDFGTYTCQAFNPLGSVSARMVLSGTPDRAQVISGAIASAPDTYQLSWEVQSYSPILEFKVAYRQSETNTSGLASEEGRAWHEVLVPATGSEVIDGILYRQKISLPKLWPATSYDLYVRARNKHGWNAVSNMYRFSTLARGEVMESRSFSSEGGYRRRLHPLMEMIYVLVFVLLPILLSDPGGAL